ncbi:VWA domain-containing protein [Streptomyces sp. NPDC049555]|uniref:VWA domain-containing protein n=1 Tax=Streptomyces sp. NPDC049555 TaxID=3154930 RepID=UPI00344221F6
MAAPEPHERQRNRALLVGVTQYSSGRPLEVADDLGDIAAVRHNLDQLREALRAGGVFDEEAIESLESPGLEKFESRLGHARDRTDGLLLVYFAGHGIVDTRTNSHGRLLLGLRDAKVEHGGPSFPGWVRWDDVLNRLSSGVRRPRRTVVILDCCYAGNAAGAWEELDEQDQERIALLLAVQKNQRIDAGHPATPTPYTAELVRLLAEGAGDSGGPVGLGALQEGLAARLKDRQTVGRKRWSPQACHKDSATVEILARPPEPAEDDEGRDGAGTGAGAGAGAGTVRETGMAAVPPSGLRRLILAVLTTAVVAAVATVVWWLLTGDSKGEGPAASCANHPPLELRVLTDPDLLPVTRKAADGFVASRANTDEHHCRRTGITVYSAGAAETVEAFRTQYGEWAHVGRAGFNPVGTVGPQPDVWIPASSAGARRAQDEAGNQSSVLTLDFDTTPLAYTPMVLLLPEQLAEHAGARTGRTLAELMTAMKGRNQQAEVRRPDPALTDAGLAAALGLYRTDAPRTVEMGQRRQGRAAPTGRDLVCALARGNSAEERATDRRTAVLVAEPTLAQYRSCVGETGVTRVAEYPDDVPALDPVFVHVRWNGARRDENEREAAVRRFHDWLTSDDGRKVFQGEALRSTPGSPLPSPPAGLLSAGPGPLPRALTPDQASDTLEKHRQATAASRVSFLLDSSGSMSRWWDGPNGAREILKQSLSRFGPDDTFGVWSVASAGSDPPSRELLPFGTHGSWSRTADKSEQDKAADAGRKIDAATPQMNLEADIGGALRAALDRMPRGDEDDGHPQLVVLLTDDEDNDRLNASQQNDLLSFVRDRKVPVTMVSFDSGGCLKDRLDLRVAEASGGTCLDGRGDLAKGLDAEIAQVAQGRQ